MEGLAQVYGVIPAESSWRVNDAAPEKIS